MLRKVADHPHEAVERGVLGQVRIAHARHTAWEEDCRDRALGLQAASGLQSKHLST